MNRNLRLVGVAVAFALGFGGRMLATPAPVVETIAPIQAGEGAGSPPTESPAPGSASGTTPTAPTKSGTRQEAQALKTRLDELQKALAVAEEAVTTTAGTPVETPADLPHVFTEEGVEQELSAMLDELDAGRLVHLDCGEFPCIAQVVFDREDADELMPLQERFLELHGNGPYGDHGRAWPFWMTEPDSNKPVMIGISLSLHGEMTPEEGERVEFRIQEALSLDPDRLVRAKIDEVDP